ncbi:MAG: PAS domain-containing protein [Flavobacteriales bacterium]|nr:PAS domain-containing protein [Flavobacteriales bacterium]
MTNKTNHQALDHATLDDLIEGYQLIGFDWRYLYVNKAVIKQSKYTSKNDLVGHTMMEKYPGIETTDLFKLLEKCMKTRTSSTMINEFTFPDNSKGWFELRIEPVPRGLFILSIDITERKRAEEAKKEYINSLEEMIYMTSHKIRQPICNIKGIINLLNNTHASADVSSGNRTYLFRRHRFKHKYIIKIANESKFEVQAQTKRPRQQG